MTDEQTQSNGTSQGETNQQSIPTEPMAEGMEATENTQANPAQSVDDMTIIAKQALADLSNYRKRVEEEKKSIFQFANMKLLLELLGTVDNFDRAISSVPAEISTTQWFKGVQGIDQQLHALLEKYKVQPIISVGQKLDPSKHEALMQAPGEKDMILEEFEKGYMIEDRVLRVAKVKVGGGM